MGQVDVSNIEAVLLIRLTDEQIKFAGTASEFISSGSDTTHLYVIKNSGSIVGFFKLDLAYSSNCPFCPPDGIGLRAFAIDINYLGKRAVKSLIPYINTHYSMFNWICLTVNCKNQRAKVCYEKGGFESTSELYLGGLAGPQRIMRVKSSNQSKYRIII
ncbi:GNAT family N-acetyltransferase [Vibrio vulnificus]|uniref:GNAT family N-acetyltransferase n=1 Tax=Vibrio vulnificus TaxID=672 RepID=UPI001CCE40BC|nr:GNAT family N-acetyltransferase [Vibrio vulnificus]